MNSLALLFALRLFVDIVAVQVNATFKKPDGCCAIPFNIKIHRHNQRTNTIPMTV